MKKKLCLIGLMISGLIMISCKTVAPTARRSYAVNKVPKLLDAGFTYVLEKDNIKPVKEVKADVPVFMFVSLKDSDFNAEKIIVTASREGLEDDTQTIYINKADGEEYSYGVDVTFKDAGEWKFLFYIVDKKGNKSNEFRTSLNVVASDI